MRDEADIHRLNRIHSIYKKLEQTLQSRHLTPQDIQTNYEIQWMVTTPLYDIGEQVYGLSKEFKAEHPEVPWSNIAGLRHRLVHDYEATNWEIISDVLFKYLPEAIQQIRDIRASYYTLYDEDGNAFVPNDETIEAMIEADYMIATGSGKTYSSVEEMFEDLLKDD